MSVGEGLLSRLRAGRRVTVLPISDPLFLPATSVAMILVGVAMLAAFTTLVLGAFGEPERSHKAVLLVSLMAIWATAILVVVRITLSV